MVRIAAGTTSTIQVAPPGTLPRRASTTGTSDHARAMQSVPMGQSACPGGKSNNSAAPPAVRVTSTNPTTKSQSKG